MKTPVFLLAFILCGFAATASAATLVVTKTADTDDGVCDADCSLREAVTVAAAGDTVLFSSFFNSPQTIPLTLGQIEIARTLTINGTGSNLLTVSGTSASRVFRISGGPTVNISGMKVNGGHASYPTEAYGGGIYVASSVLNLSNMDVRDNSASYTSPQMVTYGFGGGIYVSQGTLNIVNSSIMSNFVPGPPADSGGGGIYIINSNVNITSSDIRYNYGPLDGGFSNVSVVDSTIIDNVGTGVANGGGGSTTVIGSIIRNNDGGVGGGDSVTRLTIDRSVISDNQAGVRTGGGPTVIRRTLISNNHEGGPFSHGGGLYSGGNVYVYDSAIVNNSATVSGGGIFNYGGLIALTNCTVSGNQTGSGGGGGIYVGDPLSSATLLLTNTTVAANRSFNGPAGGVYVVDTMPAATARIGNSIIAGNISGSSGQDIHGNITSEGFNLINSTYGSTGWLPTDIVNIVPLIAPLGNNGGVTPTHGFLPGCPAINGGSNALAVDPLTGDPLTYDQRGWDRLVGGTVDIGAYEANYAGGPVTVGGRITTLGGRGISNVRVTLTNDNATLYAQTNPFGYYRFANLTPGTTYTAAVTHKYYQFDPPLVVTIDQPRDDLNFVAQGP